MGSLKGILDNPMLLEDREPPLAKLTQTGLINIKSAFQRATEGVKNTWTYLGENRDVSDFMFPGLKIKTHWAYILLWMVTFLIAFYFEACKLCLAKLQRDASKLKYRNPCIYKKQTLLMKINLTATAVMHSVIGYLLMMAVMMYLQLLVAVVLGMMLGYFLFGILQHRLNLQCFCGCIPKCKIECDDAGGDRCYRNLCDAKQCADDSFSGRDTAVLQQTGHSSASKGKLIKKITEMELRQTDLQPALFHYEGDRHKSMELYQCSHESLPKLSSKHESLPFMTPTEEIPDQYELHPEYYYTCDQGHLHHYPEYCPHLMKAKLQYQSLSMASM